MSNSTAGGTQGRKGARMSLTGMLKRSRLTYTLANAVRKLPYPLISGWMRLCHRLHGVEGNKVFFSSYDGTLYNDNPRAVAEALHAIAPQARIVFRLDARGRRMALPDWVEAVPKLSMRTLREMATARAIVTNAGMKTWMVKFGDQFYVQTWHGDRGFKKIYLDVDPHRRYYLKEVPRIDLAVSGSAFGSGVYRTAMGVRGEILECGYPRNDLLVKNPPEAARRARSSLGIPEDVRVLMYAPTFRSTDTGGRQAARLSLERVRQALEAATGERWFCVTRSHEVARGIAADTGMDVSDYPETTELLLAVDMLITDYSSIGGDFMLLNRPVIYFQPDRADYDRDRGGLYFDPDRSPLMVVHSEAELLELLARPFDAARNCREALAFFGCHETGRAAEAVARRVAQQLSQ